MVKKATLLVFFATIFANAQIRFEKGFIIDNSGNKTECLIRNLDWKNNPTEIEYKLSENSEISKGNIKNIKGFEIQNGNSYLKADVKIDRSSTDTNNLSNTKEPNFSNEQLFLKKLVSGDANLYQYTDGNLNRFFYQVKDQPEIEQLIYKVYEIQPEYIVVHNKEYINQLSEHLKCASISEEQIENTYYKDGSLTKLFLKYNQCANPSYVIHDEKKTKGIMNLNLRPSLNFTSFSASIPKLFMDTSTNLFAAFDTGNLGTKMGVGFGLEFEYIMEFNRNKWAFIIEPNYQYYKAENTQSIPTSQVKDGKLTTAVDYKSITIPVGFRHYMFLNSKSKIFLNLQYAFTIPMNSNVQLLKADNTLANPTMEMKYDSGLALGAGYNFDNKYGFEIKYYLGRNFIKNYSYWSSNLNTISLAFSYTLFSSK